MYVIFSVRLIKNKTKRSHISELSKEELPPLKRPLRFCLPSTFWSPWHMVPTPLSRESLKPGFLLMGKFRTRCTALPPSQPSSAQTISARNPLNPLFTSANLTRDLNLTWHTPSPSWSSKPSPSLPDSPLTTPYPASPTASTNPRPHVPLTPRHSASQPSSPSLRPLPPFHGLCSSASHKPTVFSSATHCICPANFQMKRNSTACLLHSFVVSAECRWRQSHQAAS